jgi:hypothetical protein
MSNTSIPQVQYVTDSKGKPVYVQVPIKEWRNFIEEHQRLVILLQFKERLKGAFREIKQIQKGEKQAITFNDFLNEL